ncbi:MAG: hypothetical protein ACRD22_13930 [Terriglobia bacterium]
MIAASFEASPDESGWLFLGGSVATGARFRFTSKKVGQTIVFVVPLQGIRQTTPRPLH